MSTEDMSTQPARVGEESPAEGGGHGGEVVETNPFADPGLPEHQPRRTDIDEQAARRAERQVALMFVASMLATCGFIAAYVGIPKSRITYIWPIGHVSLLNFTLGLTLAVALLGIGAGAVHWARTLMSDVEYPSERHPIEADEELRAKVIDDFKQGVADSGFGRRKLIRNTLFGALALVPLSGVVLLRDLGPLPGKKLDHTLWSKGKLIVNVNTGEPLRPEDITVGSLTFGKPHGLVQQGNDQYEEEMGKAAIFLVRMQPSEIRNKQELAWSHEGIVAFSKICTHVGCPVSLYQQQEHHVLCPCHQSTFDLTDGAKVIFGPAGHPLPQLDITVDSDGYLAAVSDFKQPVGPSFWERA